MAFGKGHVHNKKYVVSLKPETMYIVRKHVYFQFRTGGRIHVIYLHLSSPSADCFIDALTK